MTALLQTVFHEKPPFIPVKSDGFRLKQAIYPAIDIKIHDFLFIRKLFSHGKMACYSLDAITSAKGKRCALCSWNYACTKVVRLMVMVETLDPPIPAILDVADASLGNIGPILEEIPPEKMHTTLITAAIQPNAKPLKITFTARF